MKTQSILSQKNILKTVRPFILVMIVWLCANPIYAQNTERTVTGVVNTLDGPLLRATVVLKGTAIGVSTNENGAFTFPQKLKENDVLQVSYLGYENKEITINADTTIVTPFLEDIAIVIVAALRTEESVSSSVHNMN